jgi:hypothetical protein
MFHERSLSLVEGEEVCSDWQAPIFKERTQMSRINRVFIDDAKFSLRCYSSVNEALLFHEELRAAFY